MLKGLPLAMFYWTSVLLNRIEDKVSVDHPPLLQFCYSQEVGAEVQACEISLRKHLHVPASTDASAAAHIQQRGRVRQAVAGVVGLRAANSGQGQEAGAWC